MTAKKNDLKTIKKSNSLARAVYRISTSEQRLLLLAVANANGDINALKRSKIYARDYAEMFNLTPQAAYMALQEVSETLFERRFTILDELDGNPRRRLRRWIQGVDYVDNEGCITLVFSDDVLPFLIEQSKNFSYYFLDDVKALTSIYALRLYEILMSWRGLPATDGKRTTHKFEIENLREMLGVEPEKYTRVDNLKKRVLDVATKQINEHTNLIASYHQYKAGRRIAGFYFTFKFKNGYERSMHKPITNTNAITPERDPHTINIFTNKTDAETEAKAKKSWRLNFDLEEHLQRHLQQEDEKHIEKLKRLSTK